ncbi:hypothetical protein P9X10_01130 [Bacillus cereus]|nr:hypothetical protein [Bacillus cereus]
MIKQKIVAKLQDETVLYLGDLLISPMGLLTHTIERNGSKGNKEFSIVGELTFPDSSFILMIEVANTETRKLQKFLLDSETWRKSGGFSKGVCELRETMMDYVRLTELMKQRAIENQAKTAMEGHTL